MKKKVGNLMEKKLIQCGKRNLHLFTEKDYDAKYRWPSKWLICDGVLEGDILQFGLQFTIFGLYVRMYSERFYKTESE